MKILVTGGTGFLGSNFLHRFPNNQQLHVLTRNTSFSHPTSKIIYGDYSDIEVLEQIKKLKFDKVFHFGWSGIPDLSKENNSKNLDTQIRFLQTLASNSNIEINATGSCLEYGSRIGLTSENAEPLGVDDFGNTKRTVCRFLEELNVKSRWFRIFYVYGPRQNSKSLIQSAISACKQGKNFESQNPNQAHDYIYVDDCINAIIECSENPRALGTFNVGSGALTTNGKFVDYVREEFGLSPIFTENLQPSGLIADTTKIKKYITWECNTSLQKGINNMIRERNL